MHTDSKIGAGTRLCYATRTLALNNGRERRASLAACACEKRQNCTPMSSDEMRAFIWRQRWNFNQLQAGVFVYRDNARVAQHVKCVLFVYQWLFATKGVSWGFVNRESALASCGAANFNSIIKLARRPTRSLSSIIKVGEIAPENNQTLEKQRKTIDFGYEVSEGLVKNFLCCALPRTRLLEVNFYLGFKFFRTFFWTVDVLEPCSVNKYSMKTSSPITNFAPNSEDNELNN